MKIQYEYELSLRTALLTSSFIIKNTIFHIYRQWERVIYSFSVSWSFVYRLHQQFISILKTKLLDLISDSY